ncbi:hypothetical protein [Amycolatopsis sp. NPDC059021]|uniref:hypothetical protein n=1 Tax=Amycolatopsis sp. NPDC059021 TaxID=3346704 RepID=UPI003672870B
MPSSRNTVLAAIFAVCAMVGGALLAPGVAGAAPAVTGPDAARPAAATAKSPLCVAPDRGWVLFYQHSGCGGAYQGWARCGRHDFTGAMFRGASSYWDNQTGGAYADVYDGGGLAFTTHPQTGIRDVAWWENDRSEWAILRC